MQLLPPLRFRFHEDDHAQYGADWWVYDEAAIARLPVRQLTEIEAAIGMSVARMIHRIRGDYADANLAATWISRRLAGIVEPYDQYEPMVTLIDWEQVSSGDADPPEKKPSSSPSEG